MRSFLPSRAAITERRKKMKTNEQFTFKEKLNIIKQTIRLAENADKGIFGRMLANHVLQTVYTFLSIVIASNIIDMILSERADNGFVLLLALTTVMHLFSVAQQLFVNGRMQTHQFFKDRNLSMRFDKKLMNMDFIHLENPEKINQFYRAKEDLKCVSHIIYTFCYALCGILNTIVGIAMLVPMIFRSQTETSGFAGFVRSPWGFIAAVVISMSFEFMKTTIFGKREQAAFAKERHDKDNVLSKRIAQNLNDLVLSNYQMGKDIRLYDQSGLILNRTKAAVEYNVKNMRKMWKSVQKFSFMWQLMNVLSRAVMYAFAILRAAGGMMSVGEIVGSVYYFGLAQVGISNISEGWANTNLNLIYMKQSLDFLNTLDEKYKGTIPTEKRDDNEYEFEFKHVYFKYPNTDTFVLKDINLKWKIGEKMALVGRNGCG